jgi:Ni/Co efflux regulator RcnB
MTKIYKLIHPEQGVVYVGRTKNTLERRKRGSYPEVIQSIKKECKIELIEETNDVSRERYWIGIHRDTILNERAGDGLSKEERRIQINSSYHRNKKCGDKPPTKGYYWCNTKNKYIVRKRIGDNKIKYIGSYDTEIDAENAYKKYIMNYD